MLHNPDQAVERVNSNETVSFLYFVNGLLCFYDVFGHGREKAVVKRILIFWISLIVNLDMLGFLSTMTSL